MFGLSIGHLLVLLGLILLFRARKIPELAENIGKSVTLFRRGLNGEKLKELRAQAENKSIYQEPDAILDNYKASKNEKGCG